MLVTVCNMPKYETCNTLHNLAHKSHLSTQAVSVFQCGNTETRVTCVTSAHVLFFYWKINTHMLILWLLWWKYSPAVSAAHATKVLTYGLNINSVVTCVGRPAVRVCVEALKVLRLLGMSRDPVWVRVQRDGLEKGTRLSWVQPFLQKLSFFCWVLLVKLSQVLAFGDQSSLQCLCGVLDHFHLQETHNKNDGYQWHGGKFPRIWLHDPYTVTFWFL